MARRELGLEPVVALREGLEHAIQHFREEELAADGGHLTAVYGR